MTKIKVAFCDFWDVFDPNNNFITDALKKNFEVEISSEPDFVFCSTFGRSHLKYSCAKIYYTGENLIPDFNLVDYGLGFQDISFYDRYLRLPHYVLYPEDCELALTKHVLSDEEIVSRKGFCNYVISNSLSDPARDEMIEILQSYKPVASGGRYHNNVGGPVKDKIEFQKGYKFTMAFENTGTRGYTTEKIIQAFASSTVPIYWGNPDIAAEFNPKAFINCHDFDSFEDVLEEVKRIDNDDEAFAAMLKEPILKEDSLARCFLDKDYLSDYLYTVCSQEPAAAIRRNRVYQGAYYEDEAKFHEKIDSMLKLPRRFIRMLKNRRKIAADKAKKQ